MNILIKNESFILYEIIKIIKKIKSINKNINYTSQYTKK